jgi:ribosomal-protein-alanine N-acetyltransferase
MSESRTTTSTVTNAQENDIVALMEIDAACFAGSSWSDEQWLREIESDGRVLRISRELNADRLFGFYCFWDIHGELQLMKIAAAPTVRRRGVATSLMADLFDQAKGRNASLITLEVRENNVAAIGLYERHGFSRDGLRPRYYPDGSNALLMSRTLAH